MVNQSSILSIIHVFQQADWTTYVYNVLVEWQTDQFNLGLPISYTESIYQMNTKWSDKMASANSADPDQTAPEGEV